MIKAILDTLTGVFTYIKRLTGGSGTAYFANTALHSLDFHAIIISTDAVIAELYIDGGTVNQIGTAELDKPYNFSGVTLLAGTLITCKSGRFSGVKLTSGTIFTY